MPPAGTDRDGTAAPPWHEGSPPCDTAHQKQSEDLQGPHREQRDGGERTTAL